MRLRSHGIIRNINLDQVYNPPWYYEMHSLGYNYRMTDFQCALGMEPIVKT